MRVRAIHVVPVTALMLLLAPQAALAALDVTRDGTGGLVVQSTSDAVDSLVIDRNSLDQLRIADATGAAVSSSDGACAADAEQPTALACIVASGAAVTVRLGTQADTLDTTLATGVSLTLDGGDGADTFRVGSSGTTTVTDTTLTDVFDLTHATSGVTVRYAAAPVYRLVASCGGCPPAWSVRLPASPGRVLLGASDDRVDLTAWRGYGRSTFSLGAGLDRFFGSPTRRSTVDAGAGNDQLVSRAAADVFNAGDGMDDLADFGGLGDLLRGGPGTDSFASPDSRRDTIDGQGGADMCLSMTRQTRNCDSSGPVRGVEFAVYYPTTRPAQIYQMLGISG